MLRILMRVLMLLCTNTIDDPFIHTLNPHSQE